MSPKPAIILHNALLREFYMACDRCSEIWSVKIWHPLISERQILEQTLKWAISPLLPPSRLSLPAEIWKIKGAESPSAIKRKVKRFTFLVRFLKMEPPEGNLSPLEPELSPLPGAVTSPCHSWWRQTSVICCICENYVMSYRPAEHYFSLKICRNTPEPSQECFMFTYHCHLKENAPFPSWIKAMKK